MSVSTSDVLSWILGVLTCLSSLLVTSEVLAQLHSTEPVLLSEAAVRDAGQQRLLLRAEQDLQRRDYAAGFAAMRQLLADRGDSLVLSTNGSVSGGIRATALHLLHSLSPSARREWNRVCQDAARRELRRALQAGGQQDLLQVIRSYPLTSVAADALLIQMQWDLSRQQTGRLNETVAVLQQWRELGVLSNRQSQVLQQLQRSVFGAMGDGGTSRQVTRETCFSPDGSSSWSWRTSAWSYPAGPDELAARDSGPQFGHRFGWQRPLLSPDRIMSRTPGGLVQLERATGKVDWFLPIASVARDVRRMSLDTGALLEITPLSRQRVEAAGRMVYFLDGRAVSPVRKPGQYGQPSVLESGATRLVAVRTRPAPAVVWQRHGETVRTADSVSSQSHPPYPYQFRSTPGPADDDVPRAGDVFDELTQWSHNTPPPAEVFVDAPRIHNDRLYVVSRVELQHRLNCLSPEHGTLLWQTPLIWSANDEQEHVYDTVSVIGGSGSRVFCLFSRGVVAACHVDDGRILWMQEIPQDGDEGVDYDQMWLATQPDPLVLPHAAAGAGSLWAELSGDRLICARRGTAFITCLNADTGAMEWTAPRRVQGGPAHEQQDLAAVGRVADHLLLIGYGHCRALHVEDGRQVWARALGRHSGRVCLVDSQVLIALDDGRLLSLDAGDGRVQQCGSIDARQVGPGLAADQYGLATAAAWNVRSWMWRSSPPVPHTDSPDAQVLLQQLVEHHLTAAGFPLTADTVTTGNATRLSPEECRRRLQALPLSESQQRLLDLCTVGSTVPSSAQPLRLRPGWHVHPGLVSRLLFPPVDGATAGTEGVSDLQLLHPETLGSPEQQLAAARRLLGQGQPAAAELLLLNQMGSDTVELRTEQQQLLREIRRSRLRVGYWPAPAADDQPRSLEWTSTIIDPARLHELGQRFNRSRRQQTPMPVPWNRFPLLLEQRPDAHRGLIDLSRGIEADWTNAEAWEAPASLTHTAGWTTPGLIPVVRGGRVGMLSLLHEHPMIPVWLRTVARPQTGEVSAVSSSQFVVCGNDAIHSLHPLTGETLWSRDWTTDEELQHMRGQFPKIFLTRQHVILMSSLGHSLLVLDARHGGIIRQAEWAPGEFSQVIDRYLLTRSDQARKLHAIDLTTGDRTAVSIPQHQGVLETHRLDETGTPLALIVTTEPALMIVDPATGQTLRHIPLNDEHRRLEGVWMSPQVLQRSGQLMIAITTRDWRSGFAPGTVFDEPQTGRGVLLCLDPDTLDVRWQRTIHSCVIAPVYGDSCPWLVLWSHQRLSPRQRTHNRARRYTQLELTVINARTGRTVARSLRQSTETPLRVHWDADGQELEIATTHSTIRMLSPE